MKKRVKRSGEAEEDFEDLLRRKKCRWVGQKILLKSF